MDTHTRHPYSHVWQESKNSERERVQCRVLVLDGDGCSYILQFDSLHQQSTASFSLSLLQRRHRRTVWHFYENCLWNWIKQCECIKVSELCKRLIFILRSPLLCVYNFIANNHNIRICVLMQTRQKGRERKWEDNRISFVSISLLGHRWGFSVILFEPQSAVRMYSHMRYVCRI